MAISEQRLTLFALISEFEADLRACIATHVCSDHSIKEDLGTEAYSILLERAKMDQNSLYFDERQVLPFLEIGDAIKLVLTNRSLMPSPFASALRKTTKDIECLASVRNRVMHRRPLEFDDLPSAMDVLRTLSRDAPSEMPNVLTIVRSIAKDGRAADYAGRFSFEIDPVAYNNLPLSDFDDTGFLGRREHIEELRKAIDGPYPVVTVLGDGGAGKSALALHVAYDILNDSSTKFDAIIWTTAKTSRLTAADVHAIPRAIETSIGIAESAVCQFGSFDRKDPFFALRELLSELKILLFIDNLETILDQKIRDFVRGMTANSKLVFTSRVGLGEYEYVVRLPNFAPKQAVNYFRRVAQVWKQSQYTSLANEEISGICTRLNHSPLGIKWFVQAVAAGAQPQAILSNPQTLLSFCLENVVTQLSREAKSVLSALAVTGRDQSPASLHYLTGIAPIAVEEALRQLIASSLITVIASKFGEEDRYRISAVAQTYITRNHAPPGTVQAEIRRRQARLIKMSEQAEVDSLSMNYDPVYITVRREFAGSDCVAATFLRRGLAAIRKGDQEEALKLVEDAKEIAPSYFEVFRVEAEICENVGDLLRAQQAFVEAIALKPDHIPLRLFYAQFLLRAFNDGREAEAALQGIELSEDTGPEVLITLSRAHLFQQDYEAANEVLRKIEGKKIKNLKMRRKYFDLLCQTCTRGAEQAFERSCWTDFMGRIDRLMSLLNETPEDCLDDHFKEHLRCVVGIARKASICANGETCAERIGELVATLRAILGLPADSGINEQEDGGARMGGRIHSMFPEKSFGFISADDGQNFFFHRNNMLIRRDFNSLEVGQTVGFRLGRNARGVCADEVIVTVSR